LTHACRFGPFELRPLERCVLADGRPLALGARALDVLLALVERRGGLVSKEALLDEVWPGLVVEEANVHVQVSLLRKLLGSQTIATVAGLGYRFALPVERVERVGETPVHNLPAERTRFIGREAALVDCSRLLQDVRLLTLTGIGGCGKTRLALQLAQGQLAGFADGVWFVDLAPLQDPRRVAFAVAAALGVREEAGTPLVERLATKLATRRTLVVLDNCEHVIEGTAEVADALLAACGELKIIATSRQRLGLAGEQVFAVPPLSLAAAGGSLQDSEAMRLFIDRASLAVPGFRLDEQEAPAIGEICHRLEGIALAIELAAARVKMLSVAEIGARLYDRFRFLTGGSRVPPRHQTLQAALQWSHDSLSAPERKLFRELSVFAGGCTLAAATQVAGAADSDVVLELLTHLHDKSLLVVDRDGSAEPRYRMLETVREYARERLHEAGDGPAVRDRHLHFCVALADQARQQFQGPRQGAWIARLRREQENLLAAHGWCEHAPDGAAAGLQLAGSLWRYWVATAQLERGYRLAQAALAQAGEKIDTADITWRCRALWAAGRIAFQIGLYDETLQRGDQCLALAGASGDTEHRAAGAILRAGAMLATGRLASALALFEEARAIALAQGPGFALVAALHGLAEVHRALGDLPAAEACYGQAITAADELQDPRAAAVPLCNLARLLIGSGQLDHARSLLRRSLELAAAAGLEGMDEHLLEVTAGLASALGDPLGAARFSGAALAYLHEVGSQRQRIDQAFVAPLLARAQAALGTAAFADAEAAGQALSYDAAMAEVRQWLERGA